MSPCFFFVLAFIHLQKRQNKNKMFPMRAHNTIALLEYIFITRVDWGKEADWGKKTFSFKIEKLLKNKKILPPCGDKHCG